MERDGRFIGEPIAVEYDKPPVHSKRPICPSRLIWRDEEIAVVDMVASWVDFGRRGRMAQTMQPDHAARAAQRGSWGVGRFYFRVKSADERQFEIYYDRAPKNADNRMGNWFLTRLWDKESE